MAINQALPLSLRDFIFHTRTHFLCLHCLLHSIDLNQCLRSRRLSHKERTENSRLTCPHARFISSTASTQSYFAMSPLSAVSLWCILNITRIVVHTSCLKKTLGKELQEHMMKNKCHVIGLNCLCNFTNAFASIVRKYATSSFDPFLICVVERNSDLVLRNWKVKEIFH